MTESEKTAGLGEAIAGQEAGPQTRVEAGRRCARLERQLRKPRTFFMPGLSVVTGIMAVMAMVPLFSVLFMLIWRGGKRFSL